VIRKRTLGKTGLQVSELGLGGLFTSDLGGGVAGSAALVRRAIELGVNYIDTAPGYANSEETLGQVFEQIDGSDALILSTKLGGRPKPFNPQDRLGLMWSVEESLKLLKRDAIDILMVHEPDRPLQYDWWSDPDSVYGPVIDVLQELKEDGVVRYTGVGGTTCAELTHIVQSGRFDVLLTAFNYSVLFREAEHELLPAAKQQGMGIIVGSALQQGGLGRRFDDEVRRKPPWLSRPRQQQFLELYALLDEIDVELPELCTRFVISNPDVACVLSGAKTVDHIEQTAAAVAKGPLPPALVARLDEIAAMVPFRPFEEPMILPFGKPYYGPGLANLGLGVPVGKL
jgi:aryl-alcohol dehydrogenase-like predicted oxidoreductase